MIACGKPTTPAKPQNTGFVMEFLLSRGRGSQGVDGYHLSIRRDAQSLSPILAYMRAFASLHEWLTPELDSTRSSARELRHGLMSPKVFPIRFRGRLERGRQLGGYPVCGLVPRCPTGWRAHGARWYPACSPGPGACSAWSAGPAAGPASTYRVGAS